MEAQGGWGLWTTGLDYAAATLFYQLGSFSNHPGQSMGWVVALAVVMRVTYAGLKSAGQAVEREDSGSLGGSVPQPL